MGHFLCKEEVTAGLEKKIFALRFIIFCTHDYIENY